MSLFRRGMLQYTYYIILDIFPQTRHVETLVLLSKKKPDSHIEVDVEFGEGEGKISLKDARHTELYRGELRLQSTHGIYRRSQARFRFTDV